MSTFIYPENVNEPTHSTQFSFDESLICPTFIKTPSLTNGASNRSVSNDDVVEAVSTDSTGLMHQGSFMIVLKLAVDDNEELSESNKNLNIEWNIACLSHNHQSIEYASKSISLLEVDKVTKLHQASAARVQRAINIPGVEQIGLQSVTLKLSMKDPKANYHYYLICDEYRTAFIWHRGLRTLLSLIHIKQPITTIAFCVSSLDRINNQEMHDKMKINEDEQTWKWINHICTKLPSVQQHIYRSHRFAQTSCILDSSEHLSLLLVTKALTAMYIDVKKLATMPFYQLSKEEIRSLREVWLSLLADLSVAMLKEHQLRTDMKASVSSIHQQMISK